MVKYLNIRMLHLPRSPPTNAPTDLAYTALVTPRGPLMDRTSQLVDCETRGMWESGDRNFINWIHYSYVLFRRLAVIWNLTSK